MLQYLNERKTLQFWEITEDSHLHVLEMNVEIIK